MSPWTTESAAVKFGFEKVEDEKNGTERPNAYHTSLLLNIPCGGRRLRLIYYTAL